MLSVPCVLNGKRDTKFLFVCLINDRAEKIKLRKRLMTSTPANAIVQEDFGEWKTEQKAR